MNNGVNKGLALLLCDSRSPLFDEVGGIPVGLRIEKTVLGLPNQREVLRNIAKSFSIELKGEVVLELTETFDASEAIDRIISKASERDCTYVLADQELLDDFDLYDAVRDALHRQGITMLTLCDDALCVR